MQPLSEIISFPDRAKIPYMDLTASLILTFLIILFASLIQGVTAFGFAMVSVPLMLLFMPAIDAVTMSLILSCVINVLMVRDEHENIVWHEVWRMLPGAALGTIAGMLFIKRFDGPVFKSSLAGVFMVMALLMLAGRDWRAGRSRTLRHAVGTFSGMMMGATSMGGPPVVLYLTGRGLAKSSLRGTLALFFLIVNLCALIAFLSYGLIGAGLAVKSLIIAIAIIPGYYLGSYFSRKLSGPQFRRLVLISMAVIAFAEILIFLFL